MVDINGYLSSSTIHGFQYLSSTYKRHVRILWALVISFQLCLVAFFVRGFLNQWTENKTTNIQMGSIINLPFPDIVIQPLGYTYWRVYGEYLLEVDKEGEVKGLFANVTTLQDSLVNATCRAAEFKAREDFKNEISEIIELCQGLEISSGITCADITEDNLETSVTAVAEELDLELTCAEENEEVTVQVALILLISFDLQLSMEVKDYIVFLGNTLEKGPKALAKLFEEQEMRHIYDYVSKQSEKVTGMNGLPIPVATTLCTYTDESYIIAAIDNQDVYDPLGFRNYKFDAWPDIYDDLKACLTAKTCEADPNVRKYIDSLFVGRGQVNRELLQRMTGGTTTPLSCKFGSDFFTDLIFKRELEPCDGTYRSVFVELTIIPSEGKIEAGLNSLNVLRKKKVYLIYDSGVVYSGKPKFLLRGQMAGTIPDHTNTRDFPLDLPLGKYHLVEIDAGQFVETDNFRKLSVEDKNCVSHSDDEGKDGAYRLSNCIMEAIFAEAASSFDCKSIYEVNDTRADCNWVQQMRQMENTDGFLNNPKELPCKRACSEVGYKLRLVSSQDLEESMRLEAYFGENEDSAVFTGLFRNKTGSDLISLVQFEADVDGVKRSRFKSMAVVEIRFGWSDYQVITQDVKTTDFDKFSLIGGTLGLLTGFSMISIAEILFWIGQ